MDVFTIQAALQAQGMDPGPLDGIWGRKTIEAVRAFQRSHNLRPDGLVTPETERAIFAQGVPAADISSLVWLAEARRLMGVKEVAGSGSNPAILDWADDLDIHYTTDDIPWCGLFVAHCVGVTLANEPLPSNPLGARNWARFGKARQPCLGAVLVFWRKQRNSGLGHVGFYYGEDAQAYHVLGGNQSNQVSIARVGKDRFLEARWPVTASHLSGVPVFRALAGGLSPTEQ